MKNQSREVIASIYQQLEELYSSLDSKLSRAPGNPCGKCRECCTTNSLNKHYVTQLELGYIGEKVGDEGLDDFKKFLDRESQSDVCPYFDEQLWGCRIYQHRPYSCRIFGHYRSQRSELPEVCVFKGQEHIFGVGTYLEAVPLAMELRILLREFWPFQQGEEDAVKAFRVLPDSPEHTGDDLDRAMILQESGRLEEAIQILKSSDLERNPHFLYCEALVLEGLGRFTEACSLLEMALAQAGDTTRLVFRYACNLYHSGKRDEAIAGFLKTLRLEPDHAQALGILGAHYLSQGVHYEARKFLSKAVSLQPENTRLRRLLKQIP